MLFHLHDIRFDQEEVETFVTNSCSNNRRSEYDDEYEFEGAYQDEYILLSVFRYRIEHCKDEPSDSSDSGILSHDYLLTDDDMRRQQVQPPSQENLCFEHREIGLDRKERIRTTGQNSVVKTPHIFLKPLAESNASSINYGPMPNDHVK